MSVPATACTACRHFVGAPQAVEAALPALAALSSAHGASRAGDGLCALHDRFVPAQGRCTAFAAADQAG